MVRYCAEGRRFQQNNAYLVVPVTWKLPVGLLRVFPEGITRVRNSEEKSIGERFGNRARRVIVGAAEMGLP